MAAEHGNFVIEFPCAGATYCHQLYGVYEYGTYGRSSVLAGRTSRIFHDSFETLEEAKKAYPNASWHGDADGKGVGSGYVEDNLMDLPGDDDSDPYGDDREAYEDGLRESKYMDEEW